MNYLTSLMMLTALAATQARAEPAEVFQHGGGRPGPAPAHNTITQRPQAAPTQVVRPVEHPPVGGDHRPDNQPVVVNHGPEENHGPVDNHGPQGHPMRPVFSDSRGDTPDARRGIRDDSFTHHIGFDPRFDYANSRWHHFYPDRWWVSYPYPVGYGWGNVTAVTCQAQFIAANGDADPNNNDIYTADASTGTWGITWGFTSEDVISNQTLANALDQCNDAATAANDPGQCVPIENPNDIDGCFLSF